MGTLIRNRMSGRVRTVESKSIWINGRLKSVENNEQKPGNARGPCEKTQGQKKRKSLKTCKTKGGEVEKYLKEADVPLVGCFANDTENRFTAGIDNNSEEKKKNSLVLLRATVACVSCLIISLILSNANAVEKSMRTKPSVNLLLDIRCVKMSGGDCGATHE